MVWRSFVIFTRSSRAESAAADCARGAEGAAAGAGAAAARAMAAITSSFSTCPRLPEPASTDTPVSAIILAAAGAGGMAVFGWMGGYPCVAIGSGAAGFAGASAAFAAGAGADPGGAGRDLAEQRADADGRAVLGRDLAEHAGFGRVDLKRHLVGLELEQRLVLLDGVAGLLEPLADRGFADALAQGGNADFGHFVSLLSSRARRSTTRCFADTGPRADMALDPANDPGSAAQRSSAARRPGWHSSSQAPLRGTPSAPLMPRHQTVAVAAAAGRPA